MRIDSGMIEPNASSPPRISANTSIPMAISIMA